MTVLTGVAWHMGALHAGEAYAVTALALGPFVVLAIVITLIARRDRRADETRRGSRDA